jgi:hypothetical protein
MVLALMTLTPIRSSYVFLTRAHCRSQPWVRFRTKQA